MSTFPARIPVSAFMSNRRTRKHSIKSCKSLSPAKGHAGGEDARISRSTSEISIHHLREAINSLDSKMASLISQRHELESHLEQAVRLQSPVLRLPSELLSSIFVMGILGIGDENPVMVSTLMLVW